jgi:hypothetical protein
MSNLSDFSSCNNMTINNNLVVGQDTTLQNLTCADITSDTVYVENLILQSQDVNAKLLTIDDDVKVLEASVNDLSATKATITYVDTQIANLIGGATESYDTLVEIQTLLQEDDTQIDSLFTAVGLRALDANTVHKDSNEIVTGSKQFDGNIILNSNMKANNIDITPVEISRLHNVVSDIQPQINTLTTGVANLQPQQTSISATTILNDNYRNNGWFVITASTAINITLPNLTNNIGKVFWFTNQSPSACNIIGNGSNTIKLESNVGVWPSVASISITPNATLSLCFKSGGYVVLYNSYVASQLSSSTNTSVSALQTKTTTQTYSNGSTIYTRPTSGLSATPTLLVQDTGTQKAVSIYPIVSNDAFNYLSEDNDTLLLTKESLVIAPHISKNLGVRITQDDVIMSSSTASTSDNKIVLNATAKTINFTSANWISSNQAILAPDFYLSATNDSLSQNLGWTRTKTQMISFDSGDGSTVISKPGAINTPTLRINDDTGKSMHFLPNCSDNGYNYLVQQNDSVIAFTNALSLVPWVGNHSGIRMTLTSTAIGSTANYNQGIGLDNGIYFDGTNKTIVISSPNWISANNSVCATDFRLINRQESISDIISALRTADNTLADQYAWVHGVILDQVDEIDVVQTKTQRITCNGTTTSFTGPVTLDSTITVPSLRFSASTPIIPLLRGWCQWRQEVGYITESNGTLTVTRISKGRFGVNSTASNYTTTDFFKMPHVQLVSHNETGIGSIRGFTAYVKCNISTGYHYEVIIYGGGSSPNSEVASFNFFLY